MFTRMIRDVEGGADELPLILNNNTYENIINGKVREINNLKGQQEEHLSKIKVDSKSLRELKKERKRIISEIKVTKRAIKDEKKKLCKVNKELKGKRDYVLQISDMYIQEEEHYVDGSSVRQYIKR